MKKFGFLIFAAALITGLVISNLFSFGRISDRFASFSVGFGKVTGSGKTATEVRDLREFDGIDVSGVFQVEITAQKEFSVEIEADDNLLEYIKTEVRGDVLHLKTSKKLSTENPIRVRLSAPDIDEIDASGAANVTVRDLKNNGITLDTSGASRIKISGETAKLTVDVSGASKIDCDELKAENATVEASGASHVAVNVTGSLRAEASGASKVTYVGNPTEVTRKTSGAGSISHK